MDPLMTAPPPQSHAVVVRSLRRRLWRAFQDEDLDVAFRAYTATRRDYEEWLAQEAAEAEQKRLEEYEARQKGKKEKREARPAALKKFGFMVRSARDGFKGGEHGRRFSNKQDNTKGAFPVVSLRPRGDSDEFWGPQSAPPSSTHSSVSSGGVGVLQLELDPSEPFQDDDFESPHDPIVAEEDAEKLSGMPSRRRRLKQHHHHSVPRLAGFLGRFGHQHEAKSSELDKKDSFEDGASSGGEEIIAMCEALTTPLHEAARLGSGQLVRLMLAHGGEPNRRNGQDRTVLHMAAGGLTEEEEGLLVAAHGEIDGEILVPESKGTVDVIGPGVGIRRPGVETEESDDGSGEHPAAAGAKKAARAMSRFFKHTLGNRNDLEKKEITDTGDPEEAIPQLDMDRLNRRTADRMDAVLALLSWIHPEDDTPSAGEGPSINSVDVRGRTALHYAAELGRTDVCMAILSSFGTILTVVDESGQTPGELAAERTHITLAAQLEARALLHSDPYGMDDELMASVLADAQFNEAESNGKTNADAGGNQVRHRHALVPPFSWFETWTMEEVHTERNQRMDDALMKMSDVLQKRQVDREMNQLMFSHAGGVDDSMAADTYVSEDAEAQRTDETGGTIREAAESAAPEKSDEVVLADARNTGLEEESVVAGGTIKEADASAASKKLDEDDLADGGNMGLEEEKSVVAVGAVKEADEIVAPEKLDEVGLADGGNMGLEEKLVVAGGTIREADESVAPERSDEAVLADGGNVRLEQTLAVAEGTIREEDESAALEKLDEAVLADGGNMGLEDKLGVTDSADEEDGHMNKHAPESTQDDAAHSAAVLVSGMADDAIESVDERNQMVLSEEIAAGDGEQDGKNCSTTNIADVETNGLLELLDVSHMDRFLTFHGWDVDYAVEVFSAAPDKALADAGVLVAVEAKDTEVGVEPAAVSEDTTSTVTCLICCEDFLPDSPEWKNLKGCKHGFCAECLGDYIAETARSMSSGLSIACPHHECSVLMLQHEVEALSPNSDTYRALTKAAVENFIAAAPELRFCPYPGCGGVVRRLVPAFMQSAGLDYSIIDFTGAVCTTVSGREPLDAPYTYEGVQDRSYLMVKNMSQPRKAHRFCFACGEDVHWPISCDTLEKWKEKIEEEVGTLEDEDGDGDGDAKFDDVAQRLWMKANTRPCPQCKAPIEKSEGCNHMTCTNRHCRHEFCWICRNDWNMHTTKTGGFYRCNIWQAEENHEFYDTPPPPEQQTATRDASASNEFNPNDQGYGSAIHSARSAWKKSRAMARFLHHYRRYIAYSESAALERSMADTVCTRLAPVVEAAVDFSGFEDFDFGGKGISFVHAAFTELLECRSILQHSYAFAFYRYPVFYYYRYHRLMKTREKEKESFEQLQSQLVMLTEQMSDIVARSHLRATLTQIMFLTSGAAEKRRELTTLMISILDDERKEEMQKRDETETPVPPSEFPGSLHARRPTHGPLVYPGRGERTRMHAGIGPPVMGQGDESLTPDQAELSRAEDEAVQQAIRESMHAYMANTNEMSGSDDANVENDGERWVDWSCTACTYMNAGGGECAMCGSARVH